MNVTYGILICEYILENEHLISYGIAVYDTPDILGIASVCFSIPDICSDFDAVANLVHTCNRLRLSPLHLTDAVDDFIASSLF